MITTSQINYRLRKAHVVLAAVAAVFTALYLLHFYRQKNGAFFRDQSTIEKPFSLSNKAFFVYTPGCNIPKFNPFDPSVKKFFIKVPYTYNCPFRKPTFKVYENSVVSLDDDTLLKQYHVKKSEIDCTFRPISRKLSAKKPDDVYEMGKEHEMVFDLPIDEDFIFLKCVKGNETVLSDFLALTPMKPTVEERCEKAREASSRIFDDNLNILIIGIDSVSKLNFLRYFNHSLNYLRNNLSAVELHGYTKVADNTYPNLIPLLTGFHRNHYNNKERYYKFYDDAEFIWKRYASLGYRTFLSEDAPKIGTFVLKRRGFRIAPTDYYSRPFTLALEKSKLKFMSRENCIGNRMEMEVYFDYLRRFILTMKNRPFFAFLFMARLTHDDIKQAGYADKPSLQLIRDLDHSGTLNSSLLIFFSDHGIRFGEIRETYIGKVEERMPFIFLVFPGWFLDKYPVFAANLRTNENRLTTPYDVHATLLHLLTLQEAQFFSLHGQSLLTDISPMRTCADASILPHWCICHSHQSVPTNDGVVQKAASAVIMKVNERLRPFANMCLKLELEEVLDARLGKPNTELLNYKTERKSNLDVHSDYLVTLRASPSSAVFEATVRYHGGKLHVLDDISRINVYANQSHCINHFEIRKYCFCNDMLIES